MGELLVIPIYRYFNKKITKAITNPITNIENWRFEDLDDSEFFIASMTELKMKK